MNHAAPAAAPPPPEQAPPEQARILAEVLGRGGDTDPFVAAVRATRMPMVITDPRQRDNPLVFVNDAFVRLTGYPRDEILGRNCRFLQGPDTDPDDVARVHRAVLDATSIEIELRNYRKDGTTFWNRLLLAPVRDSHGTLAYFFASQLDVTVERERLASLESDNAALVAELNHRITVAQDGEHRLHLATAAGRLGVWELDLRSSALITTHFCRENLGRPPEQPLTFADMLRAIHPDDRARFQLAVTDVPDAGGDTSREFRLAPDGGRSRWVEVRLQAIRDGAATRRAVAGTVADITARKRAEVKRLALAELDERFHGLEGGTDLAAAAVAMLGQVLNVSRAGYGAVDAAAETIDIVCNWTAPGVPDLSGTLRFRDFGSFIDDLKRGDAVLVEDAGHDPRTRGHAAALKAVGAQALINLPIMEGGGAVALLFIHQGNPRRWHEEELAFIRDVANRTRMAVQRRQAEESLRALAASLEQQVADRTAELMEVEATLRQSQKMEAVGQLTGGLAHDFNNLLTGISGSLELLKARIAQGRLAEVERYVVAAQGAASRAAALTHRLLAFSRRQTLEPKVANLNRLVAGMEEMIRRTIGPAMSLEIVGASGLWNTLVDPGQLENALLNLCINARDAMPDGGRLTVETANSWLDARSARPRDLPPGQYVRLSVSDTGTGMTPDVVAKAFDPFFTTKPLGQGTGLGLSMIYGFARQSEGQVQIYSEPGQGTTVSLYLPRNRGEPGELEHPPAETAAARSEGGETVLVVDDESTVRMLVADVLAEFGYRALEAEDGPAGLRLLRTDARIDLLVTDVGLPGGMNGRQVADAARTLRPELKVLFITGYAENAAIGHGHLDPGMHVMTKPFTMDALAARIRGLLAEE